MAGAFSNLREKQRRPVQPNQTSNNKQWDPDWQSYANIRCRNVLIIKGLIVLVVMLLWTAGFQICSSFCVLSSRLQIEWIGCNMPHIFPWELLQTMFALNKTNLTRLASESKYLLIRYSRKRCAAFLAQPWFCGFYCYCSRTPLKINFFEQSRDDCRTSPGARIS